VVQSTALCFVAYYPSSALVASIQLGLSEGYTAYVYDNTPSGDDQLSKILSPDFVCLGSGKNEGMGIALNELGQHIAAEKHSHALYFDQDTLFTAASLQWINAWMALHTADLTNAAVVHFQANTQQTTPENSSMQNAYFLISSGSLFGLEALKKMGWHSRSYFLECVDYELCARAHFANLAVLKVQGCPGLDHESLQPQDEARIMGKKIGFRLYPWIRIYSFIIGLAGLSFTALRKGHLVFAWKCFRNILTHTVTQLFAVFLWGIKKRQEKRQKWKSV